MRRSRADRARLCFEQARLEIKHIRTLRANLALSGRTLSNYLPREAVMIARFYVRKGRALLHTTERVSIRANLRPW